MVQVIQPRDIGQEIGQAFGSGLGSFVQQKAQQSMVGSALQNALKDARENPDADPLDTYASLATALAGVPGGLQMLGDTFGIVRQEMIRQSSRRKRKPSEPGAPGVEEAPIPDSVDDLKRPKMSAEETYASYVQEAMDDGLMRDEAEKSAERRIALETAAKEREERAQKFSRETFNANIDEMFPEGDLDPALRSSFRGRYDQLVRAGISPDEAFPEIAQDYRAAQVEMGKLRELPKRLFFGSAEKNIKQARTTIPKLIELDPELARSLLMSEVNLGEAEASEAVRPGGAKFQSFQESFPKSWMESLRKEGPVKQNQIKEKQANKLKKFLKTSFDPESDSLLSLRAYAADGGVDDATFLSAVEEVFPDPANNPKLSRYNRNEIGRLAQPLTPGLGEIFSGVFEELITPMALRGVVKPESRTEPLKRSIQQALGKR
jgi:hypothetical protein